MAAMSRVPRSSWEDGEEQVEKYMLNYLDQLNYEPEKQPDLKKPPIHIIEKTNRKNVFCRPGPPSGFSFISQNPGRTHRRSFWIFTSCHQVQFLIPSDEQLGKHKNKKVLQLLHLQ